MPNVHPTAVLEGDCQLADDVFVGPHCVLTGPVRVGPGSQLVAGVFLHGPLELGARNTLYPNAALGYAPQSVTYDRSRPGEGLVVGDDNTFREGTTVHRAMTDEGPTRIGNHNYFMSNAHVGHDTVVGNHCVFTNSALAGGHCQIADRVNIGGISAIHQFCRIGEGVMIGGGVGVALDVPPNLVVSATNYVAGFNRIGMRRRGFTLEQINTVKWVYKQLFRSRLPMNKSMALLRERADDPIVAQYIDFIESSKRGIVAARPRVSRGAVRT